MNRLLGLLSLVLLTALAFEAGAAVPQTMSYQGVLKDGTGALLTGSHSITFRLYTVLSGGSQIWSETQAVTLDTGGFSVILGSTTPLNLPFDQQYHLGISVDGGAELSPRIPLASSPYGLSLRLPFYQAVSSGSLPAFRVDNSLGDASVGQSTLPGFKPSEFTVVYGGAGVYGNNNEIYGEGVVGRANNLGLGVYGESGTGYGVYGSTTSGTALYANASSGIGVYGISGSNYAGYFTSSGTAALYAAGSGSVALQAVGSSWGTSSLGNNVGLYAAQMNGSNAAYLGAGCCAADLYGNVAVHGTLTKTAGSFKIDHPLDPAGKYLSHSFVESPDMMNIYNGNVALDGSGAAWVELPTWFEALNMEFRYQLTAIGAPGPNLYVAREIGNNRFRIEGGTPGGKVSWLVTGVRHDKYAEMHRIPVEEEKSGRERGHYLNPELYGASDEQGIERAKHPEARDILVTGEASARKQRPTAAPRFRDPAATGAAEKK